MLKDISAHYDICFGSQLLFKKDMMSSDICVDVVPFCFPFKEQDVIILMPEKVVAAPTTYS